MERGTDIIGGIGDTPLVELRRIVPPGHACLLVKIECDNPTGSMKDRMALSVIDRAVESGRLLPSGKVVEYTGGITGTSLAFVCAAKGFPITLVTSDARSRSSRGTRHGAARVSADALRREHPARGTRLGRSRERAPASD